MRTMNEFKLKEIFNTKILKTINNLVREKYELNALSDKFVTDASSEIYLCNADWFNDVFDNRFNNDDMIYEVHVSCLDNVKVNVGKKSVSLNFVTAYNENKDLLMIKFPCENRYKYFERNYLKGELKI